MGNAASMQEKYRVAVEKFNKIFILHVLLLHIMGIYVLNDFGMATT
jgi:hypothetical protein